MITGAVIALVCLFIGILIGRLRRRPRLSEPAKVKALCEGCNHHRSFHNKHSDKCEHSYVADYQERKCTCQEYMGPEPLPPQYFAGEIL